MRLYPLRRKRVCSESKKPEVTTGPENPEPKTNPGSPGTEEKGEALEAREPKKWGERNESRSGKNIASFENCKRSN